MAIEGGSVTLVKISQELISLKSSLGIIKWLLSQNFIGFVTLTVPVLYSIGHEYYNKILSDAGFYGEILALETSNFLIMGFRIFISFVAQIIVISIIPFILMSAVMVVASIIYNKVPVPYKIRLEKFMMMVLPKKVSRLYADVKSNFDFIGERAGKKMEVFFSFGGVSFIMLAIIVLSYTNILSLGARAARSVNVSSGHVLSKCTKADIVINKSSMKCVQFIDSENKERRGVYLVGDESIFIMRTGEYIFEIVRLNQINSGFLFDEYRDLSGRTQLLPKNNDPQDVDKSTIPGS